MAAEDTVVQAVIALYTGNTTQQTQANQWLTSFQQTNEAWQAGLNLLTVNQRPEIQFFAATLLVRKTRSDWGKLEPSTRHAMHQTFNVKLQEALNWQPPNSLVVRQLCVLLAAIVGAANGEGACEAVNLAMSMLQSNPILCFELLAALGEEEEDLDRVHRAGLVKQLQLQSADVLRMLGDVIDNAQNTGQETISLGALRAATAWLRLNPVAGLGCMITPGGLIKTQPGLFRALLTALSSPRSTDTVISAAGQALLLVFSSGNFGSDETEDVPAFSELLRALMSMESRLQSCGESVAVVVAQLGSAAAERSPEICCGRVPEAVPFASLMLNCLTRPEPAIVESSMEYFLMVNTVPLAERQPHLCLPLFEELFKRLMPHASYPQGFTSWDANALDIIDQDEFTRQRSEVLPEALEVVYGLIRSSYLEQSWRLLQEATNWQAAESALYLVSAVALPVKTRVLVDVTQQSPTVAQDASRTGEILTALFTGICSPERVHGLLTSHTAFSSTACLLIERYGMWFGKSPTAPLSDALGFLLKALSVEGVGPVAAKSFNTLCLRCGGVLKHSAAVASLTVALHDALKISNNNSFTTNGGSISPAANSLWSIPPGSLALEDWQAVAGGLARLTTHLSDDQKPIAMSNLTLPFISTARIAATSCSYQQQQSPDSVLPAAAYTSVAQSLRLLASCLGQLTVPNGFPANGTTAPAPPPPAIAKEATDLVNGFATIPSWQRDESVATAVVEVYKQAICSSKKSGKELLPSVLPSLLSLFTATALPSCLDVFGEALELHFQDSNIVQALLQALQACCSIAFPRLQGSGVRDNWPLTAALLALADTFAVYAPAALWTSDVLLPLLALATTAAGLRESEPVSRALSLLSHVANTHERAADEAGLNAMHLEAAHAALSRQGEALVEGLLNALCDTCPRRHMRNAADCLRSLLVHPALGQNAGRWFLATVQSGRLPGVREGNLTEDDCRRVCAAALSGGLRGGRLIALLVDFGLVARRENTSDVLLAYEL